VHSKSRKEIDAKQLVRMATALCTQTPAVSNGTLSAASHTPPIAHLRYGRVH
jgi:hypothetical protein